MPLYEYECTACHRRTEKIQKFSDTELTICPHCGGPLERTLTAPNVQFKGGGWYKDLYSSTKPAGGGSGETSDSGSGASDAGTSDAGASGAASTTANDRAKSGETAKPSSTSSAAATASAPSAASASATKP